MHPDGYSALRYYFTAYKTVLHSYGLDSNPGSDLEDAGSDLEVMDVSSESLHFLEFPHLFCVYVCRKPTEIT